MDFVEQKLDVFNKAIDLQSATMEESMEIKFQDVQQAIEEFRIMIETDMKKKTRGATDYTIERAKILKNVEDLEEKVRKLEARHEGLQGNLAGLLEVAAIQSALACQDEEDRV